MTTPSPLQCAIVHVDDDHNDHFLFEQAAIRTSTPFHIQPFFSGAQAIAYLQREAHFPDPPTVFLLCDCNPRTTECQNLIAAVRALVPFANLPIIVFSGSDHPTPVSRCYAAGADHFLCKPFATERMDAIARTLYACAMSIPRSFDALTRLEEYQPRL